MRLRFVWLVTGVLALALVGGACSDAETATTTTTTLSPPTTVAAAAPLAVTIAGFAFDPADVTVPVGTTVTWTNRDGAPHTITSEDGTWESGNLGEGASFTFTLDTPGEYAYYCSIHPSMEGTIRVEG